MWGGGRSSSPSLSLRLEVCSRLGQGGCSLCYIYFMDCYSLLNILSGCLPMYDLLPKERLQHPHYYFAIFGYFLGDGNSIIHGKILFNHLPGE